MSHRTVLALALTCMLALAAGNAVGQPEPLAYGDEQRAAAIDSLAAALNQVYVFPAVATDMEDLLRRNLREGVYGELNDAAAFAERLTEDLHSVSHDLHLRIGWAPPRPRVDGEQLSDEAMRARHEAAMRRNNYNFREVKLLAGNVAYIRLDGFVPAEYGGPTAIAAMNFAANADAVIFDLRANGGGAPSMIQLLTSYLVPEPTHLNSFYVRQSDETNQFWTQAWVPGPKLVDVPVYVLTSGRTFSAAEEFTYNLKNLERAIIVGETTGGGAHPVTGYELPELQLSMSLPFGRAINPITGTNWEGTGIEPHIAVPAADALDRAHLEAVRALAAAAPEEQRGELAWAVTGLESQLNPTELSAAEMQRYAGQYGPRRIWVENGGLWYQREDRSPMPMTPMGDHRFGFADLDWFRIRFAMEDGRATALTGHYLNGRTDQNQRTDN